MAKPKYNVGDVVAGWKILDNNEKYKNGLTKYLCFNNSSKKEKYLSSISLRYHYNKLNGICVGCRSVKVFNGKMRCDDCINTATKKRKEKKSNCICVDCGDKLEAGKTRCKPCRLKRKNQGSNRKKNLRENNLCYICGEKLEAEHYSSCSICYECCFKSRSGQILGTRKRWKELENLFNNQNGKCALSGLDIDIRTNAQLDHIIPKTRCGSNEIENLQWVHEKANYAKRDMLESEYKEFIKQSYKHLFGEEN